MCLIQALHFLSIVVLFEQNTLAYTLRIWTARADIHADASFSYIGTLIFTQPDLVGSPVHVTGILKNLIPNTRYHGFHVHAYPIPENRWSCSEAGDHWNPYGVMHGARFDPIQRRHVGDLGNIWSDPSGSTQIDFQDSIIQLHLGSINSILGKSIVIHKDEDDLGRSISKESRITGNSGPRIACGNIRLVHSGTSGRQAIQWSISSRHCECLANHGQCASRGAYQCQMARGMSLTQCIGNNRWIVVQLCPFICRVSPVGQPHCQ